MPQESHGTPKRNAKSRGSLVTDFILGDSSPEEYLAVSSRVNLPARPWWLFP